MAESKSVIVFSTADWDAPYWTNKQHMTVALAQEGYRVLYVESMGLRTPKLSSGRDLARMGRRLKKSIEGFREVQDGIWILSPLVIPFAHHSSFVRAFNKKTLSDAIKKFLREHSFDKPLIWTYHPFMLDAIKGVEMGPIVYHCVDELSAVPGIDSAAFKKEERRLLKAAKVVFTTSPALESMCSAHNGNVHNFPNVADVGHFGRAAEEGLVPADLERIPGPRIGFVGALSEYKVDFGLLSEVAERRRDWQFVLIGEEIEGQSNSLVKHLRILSNVHFLGYRSYQALPDYLRGIDVALLPALINDYTRAMFPMKYFEYLAAGIPVVSTPLDFAVQHRGGLVVAEGVDGFTQAIERQLNRGKFSKEEAQSLVADNTWNARLMKMLKIVEKTA